MKKLFFISILLLSTLWAGAQIIREGKVEYNKKNVPALIVEFNYISDIVEDGIVQDMKTRGFGKGNNSKGFIQYLSIEFLEISKNSIDIYYKIDEKPKEKTQTVLYMLLSTGNENFVSGSSDAAMYQAARDYIKRLIPIFDNGALDIEIEMSEELVKDQEKELEKQTSDLEKLEQKKNDLEIEIQDAQKLITEQKEKILLSKQTLENLKAEKK